MLKYSTPLAANLSAISLVVTTAATGWPLPIGLPSVTMSGHTPGGGGEREGREREGRRERRRGERGTGERGRGEGEKDL